MLILLGVLTGVTAIVLLLAGELSALQNAVIAGPAPFLLMIAALAVACYEQLADDARSAQAPVAAGSAEREPIEELVT